jgi:hypothetical protein
MEVFVGYTGTGVIFSDKSRYFDGKYPRIAFVSAEGGRITWYQQKSKLPEEVVNKITFQSKIFHDELVEKVGKMSENGAYFFLLDKIPDDMVTYVMTELGGTKKERIKYMCDILGGKIPVKR